MFLLLRRVSEVILSLLCAGRHLQHAAAGTRICLLGAGHAPSAASTFHGWGSLEEFEVVTVLVTHLQLCVVGGVDAHGQGGLFGEVLVPWQAGLLLMRWGTQDMRTANQRTVHK